MDRLDDILGLTTASPKKRGLYRDDVNFMESALEIPSDEILGKVEQFTSVVFKPDGVVAGSVPPSLRFLADNGFEPVLWKSFTYDRNMIRSAWRYQINIATPERLRVVDFLLASGRSAYLLARHRSAGRSASALLSSLKGPAEVADRTGHCFRSVLGDHNTFLNKVHVPDDGADLLREMSIYFDRDDRLEIFAAMAGGQAAGPSLPPWIAGHPTRDLAIGPSVRALLKSVASSGLSERERGRLEAAIGEAMRTARLPMETIDLLIGRQELFDRWDLAIFLTQFVQANRAGAEKIL